MEKCGTRVVLAKVCFGAHGLLYRIRHDCVSRLLGEGTWERARIVNGRPAIFWLACLNSLAMYKKKIKKDPSSVQLNTRYSGALAE